MIALYFMQTHLMDIEYFVTMKLNQYAFVKINLVHFLSQFVV